MVPACEFSFISFYNTVEYMFKSNGLRYIVVGIEHNFLKFDSISSMFYQFTSYVILFPL